MAWNTFTNNTRGFTTLTFLDVARNWLTGTLPPELANISTQYLMVSAFDNNLTGTIPSSYYVSTTSKLSWLAVAYNPSLYGAWPNNLAPMGFSSTTWQGTTSGYTTTFTYNPSAVSVSAPGYNMPTSGTGCVTATSIGLSQPLWSLLQQAAPALDPSGTALPSWRAGLQPCVPYTGPAQSTSSPVYGRSWTGVSSYCQDGAWSGGWQRCSSLTVYSMSGLNSMSLSGLGLTGTLPAMLSLVSTLTFLDVSRNALTGTLPPELANVSTALMVSVFGAWLGM